MSAADLYDRDFYLWTQRNAELLRSGRVSEADLEHIAEEVEDMGKRDRRELENRLTALIVHLLKWRIQPDRRSGSWRATIIEQRSGIARLLKQSPSLKACLEQAIGEVYEPAREMAAAEAGVPGRDIPAVCPFDRDQVLDAGYLPD